MPEELFKHIEIGSARVIELILPVTLDAGDFDRLNDGVLALIATSPGGRWVVDLARLDYMGSATLGLMVNIRQRVKEGKGKLVLSGMAPRLVQIFKTCCLERLFTIVRTRDEALQHLR